MGKLCHPPDRGIFAHISCFLDCEYKTMDEDCNADQMYEKARRWKDIMEYYTYCNKIAGRWRRSAGRNLDIEDDFFGARSLRIIYV